MYFFTFHCQPNKYHQLEDVKGAYINCWINLEHKNDAEQKARKYIQNNHWEIVSLEENYIVKKEDYKNQSEGSRYYKQALVDDWVIVIHSYS